MSVRKIWFAGSGDFAKVCFGEIIRSVDPEVIITSPPRKAGRGLKLKPTPLECVAHGQGYSVHNTLSMSKDPVLIDKLERSAPEMICVIDFGQKISEPFLNFSELGCLNVHPSLLPEYRGAAPVQRAVMDGKKNTGVTVFRLAEAMDSGPILLQSSYPIGADATSGEVTQGLAKLGSMLLLEVINNYIPNNVSFLPQDRSLATFAPKISKEEALLDVMCKAETFHNKVRALNPHPGAFLLLRGGKRLKIWRTEKSHLQGKPGTIVDFLGDRPVLATSGGSVVLISVQPEGKPMMDASSWSRGMRFAKGDSIL